MDTSNKIGEHSTERIGSTSGKHPSIPWSLALIPAASAFLVHIPALWGGWVWDDLVIIRSQLPAFRSLRDLLFPPEGIINFSMHYYRPLTVVSYLLDRGVYGEQAFGFHLTLLLAHAAVSALLFLLARSFFAAGRTGTLAALAASLLFSVHPVHAESVSWIAGRADVLAAIPLLAAAILLRRQVQTIASLGAISLLFAAACLFKEAAFGFLPIAALVIRRPREILLNPAFSQLKLSPGSASSIENHPLSSSPYRRTVLFLFSFLAIVTVGLLLLRAAALGGSGGDAARNEGFVALLRDLGGALAFYLPRAVIPLPLRPLVDTLPGPAASWLGLAASCVIITAGFCFLHFQRLRLIGIGILSFFALIAPSLVPAVLKISVVPAAERYLYLPTVALALSVAGLLAILPGSAWRFIRVAVIGILIAASILTFTRTRIWGNEVLLWRSAVATSSASFAQIELATTLDDQGSPGEAEAIYRQLLDKPERLSVEEIALVRANLGIMLRTQGKQNEALKEFEEAVRLDPRIASAWFGLATCLLESAAGDAATGEIDHNLLLRIEDASLHAAALSPFEPEIFLFLGRTEAALGKREEARTALHRAISLDLTGEVASEARLILSYLE